MLLMEQLLFALQLDSTTSKNVECEPWPQDLPIKELPTSRSKSKLKFALGDVNFYLCALLPAQLWAFQTVQLLRLIHLEPAHITNIKLLKFSNIEVQVIVGKNIDMCYLLSSATNFWRMFRCLAAELDNP